jgi:hypothetical protein
LRRRFEKENFMLRLRSHAVAMVLVVIVMFQLACPKQSIEEVRTEAGKIAKEVVGGLNDTIPIFQANGLDITQLVRARDYGQQLITALETTDGSGSGPLLTSLINTFSGIIASTDVISDPRVRTIVLVSLAVANIALRRLADKLDDAIATVGAGGMGAAAGSADARTARAFKRRPAWRCRNSQTGRFATMDFCRAYPAISQVETR